MQTETPGHIAAIDIGVLDTPEASDYFSKADHRIMCGCRATLEMLGIPLPAWARRKPTGPKPGRAIAAAFRADNPETLHQATMRRSMENTRTVAASHVDTDAPMSLTDRLAALKAAQPYSTANDDVNGADPLSL